MGKNSKTTFWNFIGQHDVEIPIIQRDYAQGRKGKEFLRRTFLASLKQALDGNLPNGEKELKLDFVYGVEKDNKLNPLDGQQRLTTLWLLHWYIALKSDNLDNVSSRMYRFSYETRISSREFCHQLCKAENFRLYKIEDSVANYIQEQTWFYSAWKQDPTIQSMLRMIAGEEGNDGLEKIFSNHDRENFQNYWESLTSADAPIVFCDLPMKDFGLSDDLYIKMNARGKQLTAFENFKADLVGFMHKNAQEDKAWGKLIDVTKGIPIKLDTAWTNLFWKQHSSTYHIDEIYFAFLNRFFWNELFIAKNAEGRYILKIGKGKTNNGEEMDNIENGSSSYNYFNADNFDKYEGLDPYRYADDNIPIQLFRDMECILDRYIDYSEEIPKSSWNDDFYFLPKYEQVDGTEEIKISSVTQLQRVLFFAVCKYFKEGKADKLSLTRWMRVACNVVGGEDETGRPQIRSTDAIRKVIEYLSGIDSHNTYDSLCNQQQETDKSALGLRWDEEIAKAKQIWDKNSNGLRAYNGKCVKKDGSKYETWEEIIIEAEQYAFFKGAVRFLFSDEEGKEDWNDFDTKWNNVQLFFKRELNTNESVMNDDYQKNDDYQNARLLKSLISTIPANDFWDILHWKHKTFNNRPESWMYYLLNDNICPSVHQLLMNGADAVFKPLVPSEKIEENIIYLLSNTGLMDFVIKTIPTSWIRDGYHGHWAIYPSGKGVFLNAEKRDKFLLETEGVTIDDEYKIENTSLLYGSDINFKYKGKNYQWDSRDHICLMRDDNPSEYEIRDENKEDEDHKYYCFDASNLSTEGILDNMEKLQ